MYSFQFLFNKLFCIGLFCFVPNYLLANQILGCKVQLLNVTPSLDGILTGKSFEDPKKCDVLSQCFSHLCSG